MAFSTRSQSEARPASPRAASSAPPRDRERRGRRLLLLATAVVVLGSFLPWVSTALGNVPGYRGGGLWTFYAAMLGLTGALLPWRRVAAAQAGLLALVALALPVWQVVHLVTLVGFEGWLPGIGLVMVFGGGLAAVLGCWRISTPQR